MKLLAVSGGADSMYMLHLYKDDNIAVACVNYNIRDTSDVDYNLVKEYCELHNIMFHGLSVDKIDVPNSGVEDWARKIRYEYFIYLINIHGYTKLLTAHHKGDQNETVLMRIYRSCGIKGLQAIHKNNDFIERPLLHINKDFIYSECKRLNIKYVEDYTNHLTIYTRNIFRHKIVPKLIDVDDIAYNSQQINKKLTKIWKYYDDKYLISNDNNIIVLSKEIPKNSLSIMYVEQLLCCTFTFAKNILSIDPTLNVISNKLFHVNKRKKSIITIQIKK